jgi:hypothetical protein
VFDDPELEAEIEDLLDFREEKASVLEQLNIAKKGVDALEETIQKPHHQQELQR